MNDIFENTETMKENEHPRFYTAESVMRGHPDKLCDLIADSVLDACLQHDPASRVACEVMATHGHIIVAGEITTSAKPDVFNIVRDTLRDVGYDPKAYQIDCYIHDQSPDIAGAVEPELAEGEDEDTLGAGDQGVMVGYACNETPEYLPIMSNHHLRNKALSLKAKGLLSLMLSLPEDWDYTTRGLASICKEGVDSVCATVRELEAAGYIIRRRIRDKNGQMRGMEYTVLEQPQPPEQDEPSCAQPKQTEPKREKPVQENPAQLNTKEIKKEETNNVSNPIRAAGQRTEYRALLLKNIEYPILAQNNPMDTMRLDELVELMLDVVCSKRAAIRIAGENMPAEVVKSRFLKLNAEHIQYVLDCLKDNPPRIRNIKQYLLAALYNAPLTIENYYAAQIDHDLCGRN